MSACDSQREQRGQEGRGQGGARWRGEGGVVGYVLKCRATQASGEMVSGGEGNSPSPKQTLTLLPHGAVPCRLLPPA